MKMTKLITGFLGAFMISLVVISSVSAFQEHGKRNFNPENFEAMKKIMENKDFEGWKALEQEQCQTRLQNMTEEDFNAMTEKHLERSKHMEEMKNIMDSGNYEAWKQAIENSPRGGKMMEEVTEEQFQKMVEAHKLMQAGDFEGAKAIQNELGLQKGFHGHGKGFRFQK